jgi:prepilin-type N-terminal cleavage/methylation domain-containing protein
MMPRLRKFIRRLHGDEGLSLIEMVVVTLILGVVLAMVQQTTIQAQKELSGNSSRLDQLQQSKVAMESMSKVLRTSVLPTQLDGTCPLCATAAFLSGDVRSVQFYANINNDSNVIGPSQVSYIVAADGTLTEYIHGPNPHAANDYNYQYTCVKPTVGCVVNTRILARHVDTTQPMFTYYDASGTAISPMPLNGAALKLVDSIDVVIRVKVSKKIQAVTLTQRVTLPNADAVQEESPSS